MLLDQSVVAGLGNIYVCEALFRARIRPDKAAGQVSAAALGRLVPAIRTVLGESIAAGGSTIRDYAQPNGELGYFAAAWQVYGREGQPCGCGAPVSASHKAAEARSGAANARNRRFRHTLAA